MGFRIIISVILQYFVYLIIFEFVLLMIGLKIIEDVLEFNCFMYYFDKYIEFIYKVCKFFCIKYLIFVICCIEIYDV